MRKLVTVAIVGGVAQLVDGALGMGYGVTSTTLLLATGVAPAIASASIHLSEVGTTLASGAAHARLGNVDWRTVRLLALPGAIGGFSGALLLSSIDGEAMRPIVSAILILLGIYVLIRTLRGPVHFSSDKPLSPLFLRSLGLFAGAIDAIGGGGWGPVGTPTLLASGRLEPRKVIGSVDTSEFVVALGASIGFLLGLQWNQIPVATVLALLAGGLVAAPLAAYLVRIVRPAVLGVAVSASILVTNARTLLNTFGVEGSARSALYVSILAVVGLVFFVNRSRILTPAAPSIPALAAAE